MTSITESGTAHLYWVGYGRTVPGDERRLYDLHRPFTPRWPLCVVSGRSVESLERRQSSWRSRSRANRGPADSGEKRTVDNRAMPLAERLVGTQATRFREPRSVPHEIWQEGHDLRNKVISARQTINAT